MEELRQVRPGAEVIAVHGDWAYVTVGYFDPHEVNEVFEPDNVLMIIRITKDFPEGRRPYGVIAVPSLERADGQDVRKQFDNHQKAQPVCEALGTDDVGLLSWKWENISWDTPEALRKAPAMVHERLRME